LKSPRRPSFLVFVLPARPSTASHQPSVCSHRLVPSHESDICYLIYCRQSAVKKEVARLARHACIRLGRPLLLTDIHAVPRRPPSRHSPLVCIRRPPTPAHLPHHTNHRRPRPASSNTHSAPAFPLCPLLLATSARKPQRRKLTPSPAVGAPSHCT
jgi:hypothetical protein